MQLFRTQPHTTSRSLSPYWQALVQPVLLPFVLSRCLVIGTGILQQWLLDTGRIYKLAYIGDAPLAPLSAMFDANWYGMIATMGYSSSADITQPQNYHFFPLYPLLMRLTGDITGLGAVSGGYYLAGMILSNLFFLVALVLLYKLTMQVWLNPIRATRTIWLMCALPWAYVFSMTYTESLFLLLTSGALLVAYNNRLQPTAPGVALATLLVALATLTRPQGFIVAMTVAWLVAIAPATLAASRRVALALISLAPSLAVAAGFALYIAVHTHSDNLLAIQQTTTAWGAGLLADLPRVIILPPANPVWFLDTQATLTLILWTVLTVGLLVQAFRLHRGKTSMFDGSTLSSRANWALVIYASGSFLVTLLGNPMNIGWGRYMLLVVPLIWMLARYLPDGMAFQRLIMASLAAQVVFLFAVITLQFTP